MSFSLENLVRENIKTLAPYSSARHEFTGNASIYIDANENAEGSPFESGAIQYNRYPDPYQWQLKFKLARIKGVPAENIFIGNGSDEVIDLAYRIFCNPGKDNVIICPPTYGMYSVSAEINDVVVKKVPLTTNFQLQVAEIKDAIDVNTKLIFICSPNNPTGNSLQKNDILNIIENFNGIVIIDEAYINFSKEPSLINILTQYPNVIIMQTLSKAWGLAALRIGMCFASLDIINLFNKVKPPYNISQAAQELAEEALKNTELTNTWTRNSIVLRNLLAEKLQKFDFIQHIYPSDANFLLVKVTDANNLYKFLTENEIVARNRTNDYNCANCIRFTIGTEKENNILLETLKKYK
jgi:histidinol-phosphate aminotransferase